MTQKSYSLLNIFFILFICGIFLYCFFVNSLGKPVSCIHHQLLGINCPSCGLTRSLSALLHNDYKSALEWNKYGSHIFLFFLIQLGLRVTFPVLVYLRNQNLKIILKSDGIISLVLFLVCFYPFIFSTFYLFYKMLSTGNVNL